MAISLDEAVQYLNHFSWSSQSQLLGKSAVKEALQEIENAHKWRWLQTQMEPITMIGGQDHFDLPDDFRDYISCHATDGLQGLFQMVDIDYIARLRSYSQQDTTYLYYGAIEWVASTALGGGPPVPRVALWPIPTATSVDYLTLVYRREIPVPEDDDGEIGIPKFMESLFKRYLEAISKGYSFDDGVQRGAKPGLSMEQRLLQVRRGPTFSAAKERDGSMQPSYGPMRNGHAPERSTGPYSLANTVAAPS